MIALIEWGQVGQKTAIVRFTKSEGVFQSWTNVRGDNQFQEMVMIPSSRVWTVQFEVD